VLADSTTRGAGRRPTSTPFQTLVFAMVSALAITTLAAAHNAWIALSLKPAVALQSSYSVTGTRRKIYRTITVESGFTVFRLHRP
jgi:hypothetical protein